MNESPLLFLFLPIYLAIFLKILTMCIRSTHLRSVRALGERGTYSPFISSPILFMAIKGSSKKTLIKKHQTHQKDTGSPQVQIAILTKEIAMLTKHLQEHQKDFSARRGLLGKVARRRTLLTYLRMNNPDEYQTTLEANKLKK